VFLSLEYYVEYISQKSVAFTHIPAVVLLLIVIFASVYACLVHVFVAAAAADVY